MHCFILETKESRDRERDYSVEMTAAGTSNVFIVELPGKIDYTA
jgi:hypothetical protein